MLCFTLDATKRAINFGGKKNSNFFALLSAKLISYCRCNQGKGSKGSICYVIINYFYSAEMI